MGRTVFPSVAIRASSVNLYVQWAPVTIATVPLCSGVDWSVRHNAKVLFKVRNVMFWVDWKCEAEFEK